MKYEEWIKYEETRKRLSDPLAWISYPEQAFEEKPTAQFTELQPIRRSVPRKNRFVQLYQRFLTRRI